LSGVQCEEEKKKEKELRGKYDSVATPFHPRRQISTKSEMPSILPKSIHPPTQKTTIPSSPIIIIN